MSWISEERFGHRVTGRRSPRGLSHSSGVLRPTYGYGLRCTCGWERRTNEPKPESLRIARAHLDEHFEGLADRLVNGQPLPAGVAMVAWHRFPTLHGDWAPSKVHLAYGDHKPLCGRTRSQSARTSQPYEMRDHLSDAGICRGCAMRLGPADA